MTLQSLRTEYEINDVVLLESLGSGIPRILSAYGEVCFRFTDNFIRITFPVYDHASDSSTTQVCLNLAPSSPQVQKIIEKATIEYMTIKQLTELCGFKDPKHFREDYMYAALEEGAIERLYPDTPNHPKQKYRLTEAALAWKKSLGE